jgi:hypothetical protein
MCVREVRALGGYRGVARGAGSPDYLLGRVGGLLFDGLGSTFDAPAPGQDGHDPTLHAALTKRDACAVEATTAAAGAAGAAGAAASSEAAAVGDAWPLPPGAVAGARNGWANGHFANHPPKGTSANVVGWPYDFPAQLPPRLRPLLPNAYAGRRADDLPTSEAAAAAVGGVRGGLRPVARVSRHTIVLVAAAALADGDECFLDYGFEHDPTSSDAAADSLPAWFHPAKLRGDQVVADDGEDGPAPESALQVGTWAPSVTRWVRRVGS